MLVCNQANEIKRPPPGAEIDNLSKPLRKPEFRLELMDNNILLYNPSDTKNLTFNRRASLIWQLCDGERTVEEMITLLQESYHVASQEIPADVQPTLQDFMKNRCIELEIGDL